MKRESSSSAYGIYFYRISAEWLRRFSPHSDDGVLTSYDMALILTLVGRYASAFADQSTGDQPSLGPLIATYTDLRRDLGLSRNVDLFRLFDRVEHANAWTGAPVFELFDRQDSAGFLAFTLDPAMAIAHALNAKAKFGLKVDVRRFAEFGTTQSAPIATRVLVYLRTGYRQMLGLVDDEFEAVDGVVRSARFRLRVEDVREFLGLTQTRVFRPHLLRVDPIVADLKSVGVDSEWTWEYEGNRVMALTMRFKFCDPVTRVLMRKPYVMKEPRAERGFARKHKATVVEPDFVDAAPEQSYYRPAPRHEPEVVARVLVAPTPVSAPHVCPVTLQSPLAARLADAEYLKKVGLDTIFDPEIDRDRGLRLACALLTAQRLERERLNPPVVRVPPTVVDYADEEDDEHFGEYEDDDGPGYDPDEYTPEPEED